jgi:Tfp pilus assembly protein FimV
MIVVVLSGVFPSYLEALSVGEIVVRSARGMPFLADIPLLVDAQERARGVTVTLGDAREYRSEGLTRSAVVDSLVAKVMPGARDLIAVASSQPVQEPSFDLLLLVRSGHITIVKTYHVVLPPLPVPPAPQVAKAPVETPSPPPEKVAAPPPPSAAPKKSPVPKPLAPSWSQRLPGRYGPIERGTTLYSAIEEIGVPKELLWQGIVLIWQANKHEFAGGNLHGLRTGTFLTIPPDFADNLALLGRTEAQRIIAEEWEHWQALRRATSGQQHTVPAGEEPAVVTRKALSDGERRPTASEKAPALRREKAPLPKDKPTAAPEPLVAATGNTPIVGAAVPALPKEKMASAAAVVLPANNQARAVEVAELRSVLQGLEDLLSRRLPHPDRPREMTAFVSAGELQVALQGLEERLMQRLQESLEQTTGPRRQVQPISQAALPVGKPSVLEEWLPTNTMVYVLAVENALLLFLAIGILWRWYRNRA